LFRRYLADHPELVEAARQELAGKDLACWCKPGDGDVPRRGVRVAVVRGQLG
jgi:Domain of unknown function (DUF4326)